MTTRTSLLDPAAVPEAIGRALRPLLRGVAAASAFDHAIPLRAWYPVELLRFPLRSPEQMGRRRVPREPSSRLEDHAAELARAGLLAERWGELERERDGEADRFTVDERLRDVLRAAGDVGPAAPTVVEDASYAVECAAVGEADLDRIGLHIRELEERIARLERRPLERVKQRLRRSLPRHR